MLEKNNFSDCIVYVDESGDHGLSSINKKYPVFVLVFCIFKKREYCKTVNAIQNLKFDYFGHDVVILHESDIRRGKKDFSAFSKQDKENFTNELANIIDNQSFTIIAAIIDKNKLKTQYHNPTNPYHIAMGFCLEKLYRFLEEVKQEEKTTHIIFEKRGKTEDEELELEFRRWCDGSNYFNKNINFQIKTADKKSNSAGLQLADLVARPIGMSHLKKEQHNQAFEIIKNKLRTHNGSYEGFGLEVFPQGG